ncbi:MAG: putative capsular polysaccharide synthesis family protein [Microthrixaceae bacterium]
MTIELTARATYLIARARYRLSRRRFRHAPLVVFSMAKTGSSAVVAGLRSAGFDEVHHVHDLDKDFLAREEAEYRWSGRAWRVWDAQRLLRRPRSADRPWRVVSIVRDPIAQTVSAFFQPAARRGYLHDGSTVETLTERFGDRLERLPLRWFESHIAACFGIDVYTYPFDPAQRYQIISTPEVQLLLLRCEDLEVAPRALAELLGTDAAISIPRVNVRADKDHADLYAAFTSSLRPSPEVLERVYSSRMVRHFYSPEEIARFRDLWSVEAEADADPPAIEDEAAQ